MKKDSHPQKTSAPASPPSNTILDFREYVLCSARTNKLSCTKSLKHQEKLNFLQKASKTVIRQKFCKCHIQNTVIKSVICLFLK